MPETDQQEEARIIRQCATRLQGTVGTGVNVAKVEVQWYIEQPHAEGGYTETCYEGGYWLAHAEAYDPDIYGTFERLVEERMDARVGDNRIHGYEIMDIRAA